jgi:hypothetical protein
MCAGRVPERSDVPVELAAGIRIIRPALAFPTRSGGRKPPVECTAHASSKRGNSSHCTCRCGSANHGGLTPAALANLRLRTVNVVFCSEARCAPRQSFSPASRHCAPRAGGRKSLVAPINANATAIRTHTIGGLPTNGARVCRCAFAEPRRAHARRSCEGARSQ